MSASLAVLHSVIHQMRRTIRERISGSGRTAQTPYRKPWPYSNEEIIDDQRDLENWLLDRDSRWER